jgi:hypothetical protein
LRRMQKMVGGLSLRGSMEFAQEIERKIQEKQQKWVVA